MATVLMGVLWKRVNYPAALFGLLGGALITGSLLGLFSGHVRGIPKLHFFYIGGIAEVIIVIGIAIVSVADRPARLPKDRPVRVAPETPEGLRRGRPPALVSATETLVGPGGDHLVLSLLAILVAAARVPLAMPVPGATGYASALGGQTHGGTGKASGTLAVPGATGYASALGGQTHGRHWQSQWHNSACRVPLAMPVLWAARPTEALAKPVAHLQCYGSTLNAFSAPWAGWRKTLGISAAGQVAAVDVATCGTPPAGRC